MTPDVRALSQRFWGRWAVMVIPGAPDACWPWEGRLDAKGYGFIKVNGKTTRVHRVAWLLANGSWPPPGMVVRHRCDNPPCCNPAHLQLGTVRENVADCIERDRRAHGESLRQAKLTEAGVRDIRRRAAAGEAHRAIAADYRVTRQAITLVVKRKNWRHVLDDLPAAHLAAMAKVEWPEVVPC
ncbi:hypothetical protein GCM10009718_33020 [Isoptericola halotolerans]|uniref:HNH nuclease domain-containing protein n=1 Tax=Isoptericola halotolerans TaxID=300560 RepID=A0ABX2A660_9MICO|nr:HNH endonuclease [Isoptericola halotolerans]NOV98190.1 hypothetical protein [Isoptericola halotolerans]